MKKLFLVSVKLSKWERDLQKYGSIKELKKIYRLQNHIFQRVYASHVRQKKAFENLYKTLYKDAVFIHREELNIPYVQQFPFLISFGGDNHFIYTARFASQPIIGINSDPITSTGSLLYFNTQDFIDLYNKEYFINNLFKTENWTLIEGTIFYPDNTQISTGKCISETIIRNEFPDSMSRYLVRINQNKFEEQKSSGLLLSTGAGSTGWFYNCLPHSIQLYENPIFSKDAPYFKTIVREPGLKRLKKIQYLYCTIHKYDPECTFSFTPGCKAIFKLSNEVLKVVKK